MSIFLNNLTSINYVTSTATNLYIGYYLNGTDAVFAVYDNSLNFVKNVPSTYGLDGRTSCVINDYIYYSIHGSSVVYTNLTTGVSGYFNSGGTVTTDGNYLYTCAYNSNIISICDFSGNLISTITTVHFDQEYPVNMVCYGTYMYASDTYGVHRLKLTSPYQFDSYWIGGSSNPYNVGSPALAVDASYLYVYGKITNSNISPLKYNLSTGVFDSSINFVNNSYSKSMTIFNSALFNGLAAGIVYQIYSYSMKLQFKIPTGGGTTQMYVLRNGIDKNLLIDWGDGSSNAITSIPTQTHSYSTSGTFTVSVSSNNSNAINVFGNANVTMVYLKSLDSYGGFLPTTLDSPFNCNNGSFTSTLTYLAPIPPSVTSMQGMFQGIRNFTIDLSSWDISNVTIMQQAFTDTYNCNFNIGGWNTQNVTSLYLTFAVSNFNEDISNWNTSKVTRMDAAFLLDTSFNQPIGKWDVSKVTSMYQMLESTPAFNQNLGNWKLTSLTNALRFGAESMSVANINSSLYGWSLTPGLKSGVIHEMSGNYSYPVGSQGYNTLTTNFGWTFPKLSVLPIQLTIVTPTTNSYTAIPFQTSAGKTVTINWGDGSYNTYSGSAGHTYTNKATYTVTITSVSYSAIANFGDPSANYRFYNLRSITSWGGFYLTSLAGLFNNLNAGVLTTVATIPSTVTNMSYMFYACASQPLDITGWDVSGVTNMSGMFQNNTTFNQNIGSWNVSNVTNMQNMFADANAFDQNLGNWDVSKLVSASGMLNNTNISVANFSDILYKWSLQSVQTNVTLGAAGMHYDSLTGTQGYNTLTTSPKNWTILGTVPYSDVVTIRLTVTTPSSNSSTGLYLGINSRITVKWGDGSGNTLIYSGALSHTYSTAGSYTVDISGNDPNAIFQFGNIGTISNYLTAVNRWGGYNLTSLKGAFNNIIGTISSIATIPSTVTSLNSTFYCNSANSSNFLPDITGWNTSSVTDMSYMFMNVTTFNQDISGWNTGAVTSMMNMFYGATNFNKLIGNWNVSNVINMQGMFYGTNYNQNLGNWTLSRLTNATNMNSTTMSTANINSTLYGWSTKSPLTTSLYMDLSGYYGDPSGSLGYNTLTTAPNNWTINGLTYIKIGDPPIITSIVGGNQQLTVNFTESTGGNPLPTTYYYSTNQINYVNANQTTSPITITGLSNGTYSVSLIANSFAGNTLPSNVFTGQTYFIGSAPVIISVLNSEVLNSLSVSFTPSTDGSPLPTTYYYSLNGSSYVNANQTTSPINITRLSSGTYNVSLIANSPAGNTSASNIVSGTPTTIGTAPTINSITSIVGGIIVNFTPSLGSYPTPVYYYSINGGASFINSSLSSSPITITGLTTSVTTYVSLLGNNIGGNTSVSNTMSGIPYIIGSAPVITGVDVCGNNVTIRFTGSTGGYPTPNIYYSFNGTSYVQAPSNTSPISLPNVTIQLQTVNLSAVNSAGSAISNTFLIESSWLALSNMSNRFKQTYVQGFVDISGGRLIMRNSDASMNNNLYVGGNTVLYNSNIGGTLAVTGDTTISNVNMSGQFLYSSVYLLKTFVISSLNANLSYPLYQTYNVTSVSSSTVTITLPSISSGGNITGVTLNFVKSGNANAILAIQSSGIDQFVQNGTTTQASNITIPAGTTSLALIACAGSPNYWTAIGSGGGGGIGVGVVYANMAINKSSVLNGLVLDVSGSTNMTGNTSLANLTASGTSNMISGLVVGKSGAITSGYKLDVSGNANVNGNVVIANGITVSSGAVSFPSGSIAIAAIASGFVDTSTTQTIGGAKTFSSAPVMSGANIANSSIPASAIVGGGFTNNFSSGINVSGNYSGTTAVIVTGNANISGNLIVGTGLTVSAGTISFPSYSIPVSSVNGVFVDISNAQTIAGIKTFSSAPVMSGASITAGTIPTSAVAAGFVDTSTTQTIGGSKTFSSAPVMSGANISSYSIPVSSINGVFVDISNAQTIAGIKTFSSAPVMSGASITAGTIPTSSVAAGFVDTSTTQTIGGAKTFSSAPVMSGASITAGTIPTSSVAAGFVDTSTTQTIGGSKTFSGSHTLTGGLTASGVQTITFGTNAPTMSGANISSYSIPVSSVNGVFVDISNAQTIAGIKTFSSAPVMSGASITAGTIPTSAVAAGFVDTSTTQTIGGSKTFSGAHTLSSGVSISGNVTATTNAVVVTGNVSISANVSAVSYNATSDYRLKSNIHSLSSQWNSILTVDPVSFEWQTSGKSDIGFIAQNVYKTYPHLRPDLCCDLSRNIDEPVDDSGNPIYYTIDYGRMTPFLWQGMKEIMQKISSLEKENESLLERIKILESK